MINPFHARVHKKTCSKARVNCPRAWLPVEFDLWDEEQALVQDLPMLPFKEF
jgi:hypothetical protein